MLFVMQVFLETGKKKLLETELLAKCLYEVKTTSAMKFEEHMREPLSHELFHKQTNDSELFIKAKLSPAQMSEILEHYGVQYQKPGEDAN